MMLREERSRFIAVLYYLLTNSYYIQNIKIEFSTSNALNLYIKNNNGLHSITCEGNQG